jgi:hypothetical protein
MVNRLRESTPRFVWPEDASDRVRGWVMAVANARLVGVDGYLRESTPRFVWPEGASDGVRSWVMAAANVRLVEIVPHSTLFPLLLPFGGVDSLCGRG